LALINQSILYFSRHGGCMRVVVLISTLLSIFKISFTLYVFACAKWCATHIVLCFFFFFFGVLCTLFFQFFLTVHVWLLLWYSSTFIDKMVCGINEEWNICKHLLHFSLHCNLRKTLWMLESWCYLWFGYMWLYLYRYCCLRIVATNTYCVVFCYGLGISSNTNPTEKGGVISGAPDG